MTTQTEPFITISSGGASDVPEGVYEVVLTAISDPKIVTAQRGPKAGQDIALIDWTFAIAAGEHQDKELQASSSTASGPKSKLFAFITALYGGKSPVIGTKLEKAELIGRMALATVALDEGGWPRISNLGAIPASMLAAHVARTTGAPTSGTPVTRNAAPLNLAPAAVPTQPAENELPF